MLKLRLNSKCLAHGNQHKSCTHEGCYLFTNKPQSYIRKEELYSKEQFSHFKFNKPIYRDGKPAYDTIFILPVNPYNHIDRENYNTFEGFRQSQNAVLEAQGEWPKGRDTFSRDEVKFVFIEYLEEYSAYNFETKRNEWHSKVDIKEVLIFNGRGKNEI